MTPGANTTRRLRGEALYRRGSASNSTEMDHLTPYGESAAIDIPGKKLEPEVANPLCAEYALQSLNAMEARMSLSRSRGRPGTSMHGAFSTPRQQESSGVASSFNASSINFSSVNTSSFHGAKFPSSPPDWHIASPLTTYGAGSLAFSYNEDSYKYYAAAQAKAAPAEDRVHARGEFHALQQPTAETTQEFATSAPAQSNRRREDRKIGPQHAEGVTRAGDDSPPPPAAQRDVFAEWHGENGGNFPGGSFYDPVAHGALGKRRPVEEGDGAEGRRADGWAHLREPLEEDEDENVEDEGADGRGGDDEGLFDLDLDQS